MYTSYFEYVIQNKINLFINKVYSLLFMMHVLTVLSVKVDRYRAKSVDVVAELNTYKHCIKLLRHFIPKYQIGQRCLLVLVNRKLSDSVFHDYMKQQHLI